MNIPRVVVDTNIYYQALYNGGESKQMRLLEAAETGGLEIYSPAYVKEEALMVFQKAGFKEYAKRIECLPVKWVPYEFYSSFMPEASKLISHKPDEHVVACALFLGCGILSANTRHFSNRRLRRKTRLWTLDALLNEALHAKTT